MKKYFYTTATAFFLLLNFLSAQIFTCGDTIIDSRDGKKYATVPIGSDCWFKQNLNYGTYVQSDSLGTIHSQQTNNGIPEKYAQHNDTNNLLIYGGLYEQAELMNYSSSPQGLCPNGWHVSTDAEWSSLITVAGGTMVTSSAGVGGNGLKAIGEGFGAGTGTDLVGISLMLGGDRDGFGIFYGMDVRAIYWTSTPAGMGQAYHYTFWAEGDTIERLSLGVVTTAFSCRCVKDNATGIENEKGQGEIRMYPNPANDKVTIAGISGGATVVVINALGQTVLERVVGRAENTISIDAMAWQKGLYVVRVVNAEKAAMVVKKLLVE